MVAADILDLRFQAQCEVDVYCVMPDHLNIVVTPGEDGKSSREYMRRLKARASHAVRADVGHKLWQPGWYDRLHRGRNGEDMESIAAYVLGNLVRKGLCRDPDDYPWSGVPEPVHGGR